MALTFLRSLALSLVLAGTLACAPALAQSGGATVPAPTGSSGGGPGYGATVPAAPAAPSAMPSGGANPSDPKLIAKAKARARARARAKARAKVRAKARAKAEARARARARAEARREAERKRGSGYAFPLVGPYTTGPDSGFGAPRSGRSHQGQDLSAPEGTTLVAPRSGTVTAVAYQAAGAGHYIVIDGAGEDRDYAFMHLRTGSVLVKVGDTVRTGQKIAEVGNTGISSGPHLHFEVWVGGPWRAGGRPIDPLPLLLSWRR